MVLPSHEHPFDQAAMVTPPQVRSKLLCLPASIKDQVREIRLRMGAPLHLCLDDRHLFFTAGGELSREPSPYSLVIDREMLEQCFRIVCGYSVHAHQEDLKQGFITLSGGHRVGICGVCVWNGGQIAGIRDVSSLNIRVSRQVYGAADGIIKALKGQFSGMLIAGAPGCGKTTVLRDLARQMSTGKLARLYKITVVDERGEIASMNGGVAQNNLGYCCDVLSGYPKGEAILQAIRTLSPDYIFCDEIGDERDVAGIAASVHAGVRIIATVHASGLQELLARPTLRPLIQTGAFPILCFLGGARRPGHLREIYKAGEEYDQTDRNTPDHCGWRLCWPQSLPKAQPEGYTA